MESPSQRRRSKSDSVNSPEFEFEFWNLGRNNPEPFHSLLHSADQLFSHGFLLPLHSLPTPRSEPDSDQSDHEPGSVSKPGPSALITSEASSSNNPILGASKRWREIFKRNEKKITGDNDNNNNIINPEKVVKKREKDRKNINIPGSAELNINIWPFSRSRSAGNNPSRSNNKPISTNRKVSSAPCSRSNSSGRASPNRAGVHLGRSSPVWYVKRAGPGIRSTSGGGPGKGNVNNTKGIIAGSSATGKVLKVKVPVCIGYQRNLSCQSEEDGAVVDGGGVAKSGGGSSGGNGNLFGFRGLFSKKNISAVLTV